MVLVYKDTGKVVKVGDHVRDFRGTEWIVIGMTPPRHEGSTGRVSVRSVQDGWEHDYYPSVFDMKWVKGLRAVDGLGSLHPPYRVQIGPDDYFDDLDSMRVLGRDSEANLYVGTPAAIRRYLTDPDRGWNGELVFGQKLTRSRAKRVAYIGSIRVAPVQRGDGRGSALLRFVLDLLDHDMGIATTFLYAMPMGEGRAMLLGFRDLMAWYARYGFRECLDGDDGTMWRPRGG